MPDPDGRQPVPVRTRLARFLAGRSGLGRLAPDCLKRLVFRCVVPWERYKRQQWLAANPLADAEEVSTYPAKVDVRLGVVRDFAQRHAHYVAACRDLGVPYRLVDLFAPDWIDRLRAHPCDAYLVWPSVALTVWKQMFDERLRIMVEQLGLAVYPSLAALWIYQSKRRMHYWLAAHDVPQPRTWVFYDRDEALAFAETADLPLVYKPDLGGAARGVRIFRSRSALKRHIRRVFRRGPRLPGWDPRERQWGTVFLQAYVDAPGEWRMIRVGDSYFGYEKRKQGEFHSGSHLWNYGRPPDRLLDLLKHVTDRGRFSSLNMDVFVTADGEVLVNELQAVFGMGGPYEMCVVDDVPGRMVHDGASEGWRFQQGRFCHNYLCNLRVESVLKQIGVPLEVSPEPVPPGPLDYCEIY